jgi:hypothetical protein
VNRPLVRLFAFAAATAIVVAACADSPTAPQPPIPGELTLSWTTPHADDAAAMIRVVVPAGTATPSVVAASETIEIFHRRSADTLFIAVFGELSSQALVKVEVPNVRRVNEYHAQLVDVADATDVVRTALTGYALDITRP